MGRMIEQTALAAGDSLGGVIDIGNLSDLETIGRVADVAIDFSAPAAAQRRQEGGMIQNV